MLLQKLSFPRLEFLPVSAMLINKLHLSILTDTIERHVRPNYEWYQLLLLIITVTNIMSLFAAKRQHMKRENIQRENFSNKTTPAKEYKLKCFKAGMLILGLGLMAKFLGLGLVIECSGHGINNKANYRHII